MTIYDKFITSTPTALAEWLDDHAQVDGAPWTEWFDEKYCKNCEPVESKCTAEQRSYCEVNSRCKYFPDLDHNIRTSEIIELWLNLEVEEEPERWETRDE